MEAQRLLSRKLELASDFLKTRGLTKEHVNSYNDFVNTGIKKIVRANDEIKSSVDPDFYLKFKDIKIGEPSIVLDGVVEKMTPMICRLSNRTYAAPILAHIVYVREIGGKKETCEKKDVIIGRMPVMLRSSCCILHGRDEAELTRLGECPLDPGGYFVVKGTEKVIMIQEQLSNNRIFIETDKKGNLTASVTSRTNILRSKTIIMMEKGKIYLQLNQFQTKIPIMVVLKAMGMQSDQEVVQMIGQDPCYYSLLLPSIEECIKSGVETQHQALEFLAKKVKKPQFASALPEKDNRAFLILRDVFIAHVPVRRNNFQDKCMYAGVMMRRMLDTFLNKAAVDDKDYIGNKRYELSGQLLSLLFEDSFKTMIAQVRKEVDLILLKKSRCRFDFVQHIRKDFISNPLERALSTGYWCIKRFRVDRKGVTQVLGRLSYIQTLGFLTKIHPQFEKSRKVSGPRALHPSQFGMICPCDTPEGESCGLVKNLALMSNVTTDVEEDVLISLFDILGVEDVGPVQLHSTGSFLVFFNGRILGKHKKPEIFATTLRRMRRSGKIGEFVSVFVNKKQRCVYIASDGGRICRPLVIADKGVSRIKKHHIEELVAGVRTFDDFLREGLIEYIDVNEENDTLIALYEDDAVPETTHIEIDPSTILGVIAGLIPYPNHNQSPRNTYQCAMGKQAMGNIAYNQVNYDKLGAGQNATVAVMSYSGYDIEDAIVMNKASLDRGFGRCLVMKKKSAIMQRYQNGASERIIPPKKGYSADRMQALDYDGIAAPGQYVQQDDVLVNKQTPMDTRVPASGVIPNSQYRPTPVKHSGLAGDNSVVDKVALFSDKDDNLCINLIIRQQRRPEVGDKFSSRHGQKGVCGTIVQQEDLPFSDRGICPDLIMNPHGFPSRMTCGKLIELPGSKAAVSCGRFHHGTAFGRRSGYADKIEDISETLVQHGFSYSGKDFLYSGITGEPLQAYIFMGPIYYQKLKHMVVDKMHARGFGPRALLTRQPTEGRARNGGLRVGEMERDSLIAYGASGLIYERLMLSSDPFKVQVCRSCGLMGYYNHRLKVGICSFCKNGNNISTMKIPYACKLLFQELMSINIVPRLKLGEA